jgi:hypothetical protein
LCLFSILLSVCASNVHVQVNVNSNQGRSKHFSHNKHLPLRRNNNIPTIAEASLDAAGGDSSEDVHSSYLGLPLHATEIKKSDEESAISSIWDTLKGEMLTANKTGGCLFLVHAKQLGCTTAKLIVSANVPSQYRYGVFKTASSEYNGLIRWSSGSGAAFSRFMKDFRKQTDNRLDNRAIGLKLFGVQGDHPYVPGYETSDTQDFTFFTNKAGFLEAPQDSDRFFKAVDTGKLAKYLLTNPHYGRLYADTGLSGVVRSLLHTNYHSGAPFLIGDNVVKARLAPCDTNQCPFHAPTHNKYSDLLKKQLKLGNACFQFQVQPYKNPRETSVEDGTQVWKTEYVTIATLMLPKQDVGSLPDSFCAETPFNPWHSIPAHRPVGGLQRSRKFIYQQVQHLRVRMMGAQIKEKTWQDVLNAQTRR